MNENISYAIGIIGDKVSRVARERYELAIGRDVRLSGILACVLCAGGTDRNARRHARLPVVDENISGVITIIEDEIVGAGSEDHPTAIRPKRA